MSGFVVAEDWISSLPELVCQEAMAQMSVRQIAAGAELARVGNPAEAIYRVKSGYLKQTGLQEDGERTLLTIYAAGACFAETAVIVGQPLNHTTIALTDATVECLPAQAFWRLYRNCPEVSDALCRKFAQSLRRQVAEREQFASARLNAKIASLFADLGTRTGSVEADGRLRISIPFTQFDLAAHFGVTRQSVQRELSSFKSNRSIIKQSCGWVVDLTKLPSLS
ncbi:hypothetical protein C1T17_01860 [Sphingobium sp. SCG-1]|uniref:Crp/Fnr family transcriptional regulator n=1 Tax=Sphingobium sp. SCG-1 TaxID=2072936 RepID=UPI000CD6AB60|nr:Crp/Fnr family transcriptional regulator [Sphingobium sp. SCG-1]AUW57013.1 hypothetical protein C1T17_01860 [Sphingobium sp. SCG-1]